MQLFFDDQNGKFKNDIDDWYLKDTLAERGINIDQNIIQSYFHADKDTDTDNDNESENWEPNNDSHDTDDDNEFYSCEEDNNSDDENALYISDKDNNSSQKLNNGQQIDNHKLQNNDGQKIDNDILQHNDGQEIDNYQVDYTITKPIYRDYIKNPEPIENLLHKDYYEVYNSDNDSDYDTKLRSSLYICPFLDEEKSNQKLLVLPQV